MHGTAQNAYRISYRYTPDGCHKLRLVARRSMDSNASNYLVYSDEVREVRSKRATGQARTGFGALPRKTSFTKLGRSRVRNGCAVLDKRFGKASGFFTATLPGDIPYQYRVVAAYSARIIERLKQIIHDKFRGLHLVYVWELQKRGALHLHVACAGADVSTVSALGDYWSRLWFRVLLEIEAESGADLFATMSGHDVPRKSICVMTDAQWCRESIGRYLSKYLSKGSPAASNEDFYAPSRWWGIDNWLREQIDLMTFHCSTRNLPSATAHRLFSYLTTWTSLVSEKFFIYRDKFNASNRNFLAWCQGSPDIGIEVALARA